MQFVELAEAEFQSFADNHPQKSFMQTKEIAKYRESKGWVKYYFGVKEGGELKAATLALAKPTFLGKSTFFTPGGPLIDYENEALTNFFFKHLKSYAKSHNGYVLKISPYFELAEYSRDGEKQLENHKDALKNLKKSGFTAVKSDQPKYLFVLNLNKKTPDELMASFKSNTRGHIRKAEKMGVKIRELNREELPILKAITEKTSKRRDFTDQPLSYYEQMYDLFKDKAKFLVAEVRPEKGASLVPLSAAMFLLYGSEIIYLFSGSDEKYMKDFNAQYLIQWHMIKYAAEHNFDRYNFYGIHEIPNKNRTDGVYDFKKGFTSDETGRVVELLGTFEAPVSLIFYKLHQFFQKLKK